MFILLPPLYFHFKTIENHICTIRIYEPQPHIHPEDIRFFRAISEQSPRNEDVSLPFLRMASPPFIRMVNRGGNSFLNRIFRNGIFQGLPTGMIYRGVSLSSNPSTFPTIIKADSWKLN